MSGLRNVHRCHPWQVHTYCCARRATTFTTTNMPFRKISRDVKLAAVNLCEHGEHLDDPLRLNSWYGPEVRYIIVRDHCGIELR